MNVQTLDRPALSAAFYHKVYRLLDETCEARSRSLPAGLTGMIHEAVDVLRASQASPECCRTAERISIVLHRLQATLRSGWPEGEAERLRGELENLSCDWLLMCPMVRN
jgi:hypothetical protein